MREGGVIAGFYGIINNVQEQNNIRILPQLYECDH